MRKGFEGPVPHEAPWSTDDVEYRLAHMIQNGKDDVFAFVAQHDFRSRVMYAVGQGFAFETPWIQGREMPTGFSYVSE